MGKTFSKNEHKIAETLSVGTVFYFKGEKLTVLRVAKPTVASGECKTDIYIEAEDNHSKKYEFKISLGNFSLLSPRFRFSRRLKTACCDEKYSKKFINRNDNGNTVIISGKEENSA